MQFYFSKPEQYVVAVLVVAVLGALLVMSYSYGYAKREPAQQTAAVWTPPPAVAAPTAPVVEPKAAATPSPPAEVVVHVTGAVRKRGVYHLKEGLRIEDAVKAAGGARRNGDPDALNLAAKLLDGEKIIVPEKESAASPLAQPMVQAGALPQPGTRARRSTQPLVAPDGTVLPASAHASSGPKPPLTTPISLNSATLEQLEQLPGVGPSTAQRILDYRKEHGPFTDLTELQSVHGIGAKTYERLAPHLTL